MGTGTAGGWPETVRMGAAAACAVLVLTGGPEFWSSNGIHLNMIGPPTVPPMPSMGTTSMR